ncbi:hypothetical protein LC55x_2367 [Lysobacter capsici]|nr:hypothetical protein LC55x_2367 [Lysobacter capsici]
MLIRGRGSRRSYSRKPAYAANVKKPAEKRVFRYCGLGPSRFPIPDSRFPIPDSRFPNPESRNQNISR